MELIIGIVYIGVLLFIANRQMVMGSPEPLLKPMLYGLSLMMTLFFFGGVMFISSPELLDDGMSINPVFAGIFLVVGSVFTGLTLLLIRNPALRSQIASYLPGGQFKQSSPVHLVALILMMMAVIVRFSEFLLVGGLTGLTDTIAEQEPNVLLLAGDLLTYILLTLLGVGLWIRRDEKQTLERLGLRLPENSDILLGFGVGAGMFVLVQVMSLILVLFTPPELIEQQAAMSEKIMQLYGGTLLMGVLLAASSAIGEEILFRGAIQPIFGVFVSTLFFALMHIQYTLTPASLLIFIVGLSFAWLRIRYSTTAAIIAHFIYNLIPFLLLALVPGVS